MVEKNTLNTFEFCKCICRSIKVGEKKKFEDKELKER